MSQAEVAQREMESCLTQEYTADTLPLLLHQVSYEPVYFVHTNRILCENISEHFDSQQFYTDQAYKLARCKYQLMLRWRRFGRHSAVLEKLYPQYKVSQFCMLEYYHAFNGTLNSFFTLLLLYVGTDHTFKQ